MGGFIEILFPEELKINKVVFFSQQFADFVEASDDCLDKSGRVKFSEGGYINAQLFEGSGKNLVCFFHLFY